MKLPGADKVVSPPLYWISLAALIASIFLPPDGSEIIACGFRVLFDAPCPACGLTRSVTNVSHLLPRAAWVHHPFGVVLYPVMVILALSAVVRPVRRVVEATMARWPRTTTWLMWGSVGALVVFGIARWVL